MGKDVLTLHSERKNREIMACILAIETSTSVCSVALASAGEVICDQVSFDGPSHASLVGVYVEECLNVLKERGLKLDAVAVSSGPGSYTGLRIGASVAKGLCFGFCIPLIGVHTLDVMADMVIRRAGVEAEGLYCPMIDARRMEVYAALYNKVGEVVRPVAADVVDAETYAAYLAEGRVTFFGDGAAKCAKVITSPHAVFVEGVSPLASGMFPLAEKAFAEKRFEDVAYFEPFYLKEFRATIAKNKVLGAAK